MAAKGKTKSTGRREDRMREAEPITPRDRKAVETLLSALVPISDLRDRPIPLAFVVVFLSVVLNEGQPVGWYAEHLNMTRFATYKNLQSLGERGRHQAEALRLVMIKPGDRTKTMVVLTAKGRAVAAQVFARLRGIHPQQESDREV
jgi:hypothetical protein